MRQAIAEPRETVTTGRLGTVNSDLIFKSDVTANRRMSDYQDMSGNGIKRRLRTAAPG